MNADKIKVLAEKVMGWRLKRWGHGMVAYSHWINSSGVRAARQWQPDKDSNDNDALVEAFAGKYINRRVQVYRGSHRLHVMIWEGVTMLVDNRQHTPYTTAKKNEAVCEAIYKAVTA